MDAIIQSFINEQQTGANESFPPHYYRMNQAHPGYLTDPQNVSTGEIYPQQWGMFDLTGDETFDDTLFGNYILTNAFRSQINSL